MSMKSRRPLSSILAITFVVALSVVELPSAFANPDVNYLQSCLKEEDSSLDVLVLMDSSRSLRNADPKVDKDGWTNKDGASDPKGIRGPLLKSSLKLLLDLANESDHSFRINLKNFGDNSGSLGELKSNWMDWTKVTTSNQNSVLDDFVNRALYDDSHGTEWGAGLNTARDSFNKRFNSAANDEQKSCPVMIWITDGAPSDRNPNSGADVCQSNFQYSLDWFRSNNILVLGGLLNPMGDPKAREFGPIVDGSRCGEIPSNWTQGTVIEATDVNSLAWQFVALVAGIKNLIDLSANNGKFYADKGTSHIEIFLKGVGLDWKVLDNKGKEFCNSSGQNGQCSVKSDSDIGITTITISPADPKTVQGNWSVVSSGDSQNVQVFGGISVDKGASKLIVNPPSQNVPEGKEARFTAALVNSDGSPFDLSGFRSISICAELQSSHERSCKTGATSADLVLHPSTEDSSVPITAIVTSSNGTDRTYNVSAVVKVVVSPSGLFPTLVCKGGKEGDACKAENIKNKSSKSITSLAVLAPTQSGAVSGKIYLKEFKVLRDEISTRGDGNFSFIIRNQNGSEVTWNNKSALFEPGDELILEISTPKSGTSDIASVIRYVAVVDGKEIQRQLNVNFAVREDSNLLAKIFFVLFAYLLTVGIPYIYLLISARRRAVLNPPYGEFSYLAFPFTTTSEGKVVRSGTSVDDGTAEISHREFVKVSLPENSTSAQIENATVEITPPKWNPFAQTTTSVSVPQNLVFTTSHDDGIQDGTYKFNPSLIGEAIVYFGAANNIDPVRKTTLDTSVATDSKDIWASNYEASIKEDLVAAEGPINGRIILVTQSDGNRKKALQDLLDRLASTVKTIELQKSVQQLRADKLAAAGVKEAVNVEGDPAGGIDEISEVEPQTKTGAGTTGTGSTGGGLWGDSPNTSENLWSKDDGSSGSGDRGLWN